MIVHFADGMMTIDSLTNSVNQRVWCGKTLTCAAHLPALGAAPWTANRDLVNCARCLESEEKAEGDQVAFDILLAFGRDD